MSTFLPDPDDCVYLDIETDMPSNQTFSDMGQLAMKEITCVCVRKKGITLTFLNKSHAKDLISFTAGVPVVGHNIIRFDAPILKRLWGVDLIADSEVIDTLMMSKISEINRKSHSLDSYSEELGIEKPPLSDQVSDMIVRCDADIKLTEALYRKLIQSKINKNIPDNPYKLEFRVAEIIARQHSHGISFNKSNATDLVKKIECEMAFIEEAVKDAVPLVDSKPKAPPKIQFLKSGEPNAAIKKYIDERKGTLYKKDTEWLVSMKVKGILHIFKLPLTDSYSIRVPLDINSPAAVKDWLLGQGWVPTMWNYNSDKVKTSPKLWDDNKELCPNIVKIPTARNIAEKISEYLTLRNRVNVVLGWLENYRVQDEDTICSDADTMGAVTSRFTHKIVANVPRSKSKFGKEMRGLFQARQGKNMVGWDASSLEARMEAHYTAAYDGGEYARELLEGDIHTKNQLALGLSTRDKAKTYKYAITYGASPKKLASTFNWSMAEAQQSFDKYWEANPALKKLVNEVQYRSDKGWIRAIDGRRIPVDSKHSALNRLLQSAGAIVMKYAMVIADRNIRKLGIDAHGLIRYHDEEQWECNPMYAEMVGTMGVESIKAAGRYLKLKIPLDGEFKIGSDWSETH